MLTTMILALTGITSSMTMSLSTLIAIPTPWCLFTACPDHYSSYFCSNSSAAINTESLLRRRTSWRQHIESLALAISCITLSIFSSSFPVRIFIVPILHEWKLTMNLIWKFFDQKFQSVFGRYLTLRQKSASTSSRTSWFRSRHQVEGSAVDRQQHLLPCSYSGIYKIKAVLPLTGILTQLCVEITS